MRAVCGDSASLGDGYSSEDSLEFGLHRAEAKLRDCPHLCKVVVILALLYREAETDILINPSWQLLDLTGASARQQETLSKSVLSHDRPSSPRSSDDAPTVSFRQQHPSFPGTLSSI
ncbi:hypothetical protein CDAR_65821 [Caerostris darwini]|uniref:Uncharacterized protein n=1 Tax=Caerostris darwini TaxID=1538125 RepID=A0AAV4UC91_9ARAC|nr:hypothetical protein CDAR_65821 [Caerostris darwini]